MSVERAINNMNAADHTFRSALRQHRLAPPDAGFPRRLKDFADACESQQIACDYAAQEGLGWEPMPAARRLPPPELRPDSGRRGPAELWAKFDPGMGGPWTKRLRASASPPWLVHSASWPRSRATCPPRSPKKTSRSCLACSTAEPIAEDPLGRQPTFGMWRGPAPRRAATAPQAPPAIRRRVRCLYLTAQLDPRWPVGRGHRSSRRLSTTSPSCRPRIAAFYAEHAPFQHIATRELCAPTHVVVTPAKPPGQSVPAPPTSIHPARSPQSRGFRDVVDGNQYH